MTVRSLGAPCRRPFSPLRLLSALWRRNEMVRSRRALRRLDEHLLRDIGLTRAEAEAECGHWNAPLHWRG